MGVRICLVTIWSEEVEAVVREALAEFTPAQSNRAYLGRPFVTVYQLALRVDRIYPQLARQLKTQVGGEGIGHHFSLAGYLAAQLCRRINECGEDYEIEGAQLSSKHIAAMSFREPGGETIRSSMTSGGFDTTMFRLRANTS
jgi:hypothetical protein